MSSPSNDHPLTFQQLQLKLESDHVYGSELLRKSLMNAFILEGSSRNNPARGQHRRKIKATVPDVIVSQEVDFEVCVCHVCALCVCVCRVCLSCVCVHPCQCLNFNML
jgi:hypothetical protein